MSGLRRGQRNAEEERAAAAELALDPHLPAVSGHDSPDDGQPQADAAPVGAIRLPESIGAMAASRFTSLVTVQLQNDVVAAKIAAAAQYFPPIF